MAKVKVALSGAPVKKLPARGEKASRIVVRNREDKNHTSARIEGGVRETMQRRGDFVIQRSDGNVTISADS